jgi:hypothetical protein
VADLIDILGSGSNWLYIVHAWLGMFGLPSTTLSIAIIFSGAGVAILNRFTGDVGLITVPVNYCALLFGSLFANSCLRDIRTPFEPTLQAPIIFAMTGITVASLLMMFILRRQ